MEPPIEGIMLDIVSNSFFFFIIFDYRNFNEIFKDIYCDVISRVRTLVYMSRNSKMGSLCIMISKVCASFSFTVHVA